MIDSIPSNIGIATLGGGCFWCLDAIFRRVRGVSRVSSGYSGGNSDAISYEEVSTGTTDFVEVIQIEFNPDIINYKEILDIYFHTHDPTSLNRQGNDVGPQYRSVIFYHNDGQKQQATEIITQLNNSGKFNQRIVTAVEPFISFIEAEDYHQDYFTKNPTQGYCRIIIDPKVTKFIQKYGDKVITETGN